MEYKNIPKEYQGVDISVLSPKQKRFCEEFVIDNNGFGAAERAGYNKKYSWDLLKKEEVQAYIAFLNADMRNSRIASAQEIKERLTRIARGESDEEIVTPRGEKVLKGTDIKDRIKALELLGKTEALFKEKVEQDTTLSFVIDVDMSDDVDNDDEIEL